MVNSATQIALTEQLISLDSKVSNKTDAIHAVGQLLIDAGMVGPEFIASMENREAASNTYLGVGIAIPHGLVEDKELIKHEAIAVLQVPEGVDWLNGQKAKLIVAIAAKTDSHIMILKRLTRLLQNDALVEKLTHTKDAKEIIEALLDAPAQTTPSEEIIVNDKAHAFEWTVDYPSGLHSRPSSAWAESAQRLGGNIQVRHNQEVADAKNMIELLQLGLKLGDKVTISTDDSENVLQSFKKNIEALSVKEKNDAERAAEKFKKGKVKSWEPAEEVQTAILHGVSASPGFSIGQSYFISSKLAEVQDQPVALTEAGQILADALEKTKQHMQVLIDNTTLRLSATEAEIFKAQLSLLEDLALLNMATQYIVEGHGVAWSWYQAVENQAKNLSQSGNDLLSERAADVRDVGYRVLGFIDPSLKLNSLADLPEGEWILTAEDLSPSDTVLLDADRVKGLVTIYGGPTSHTAILARTLGIPAIVAAGQAVTQVKDNSTMVVDGDAGMVYINPSEANLNSAHDWIALQKRKAEEEEAARQEPAITKDGHSVMIAANVNKPSQVENALSQGAEGVGLMRTEFLYIERNSVPNEDEQYEIYKGMQSALNGKPLVIRTLDIGGDKHVEYLKLPHETNPFLGVRGSRLLLRRLDIMLPQLKALYRAAKEGKNVSIMFPMVTSIVEIITLKSYCESIRKSLDAPVIPIGVMIEVPSAAVMADAFAEHVDFFSIGTNDLTQYTLAIDRQNPELAAEADSLHPAVLHLIKNVVEGAEKYNKPVAVCGGLAGDPIGALILTGLGVDELSMTPRDIPAVKAKIRAHSLENMKKIANEALTMECATEVRTLAGEMS